MASAETASASSLGPRYAPEDPTLPKPWKGLIDGSTGLLYYWNPETNVTQYDRPVSMNPPLPPGPPPTTSASQMNSVHVIETLPLNASATQQQKQGQPAVQQLQSLGQQMPVQNSPQLLYHQTQTQTQPMTQEMQQHYPQLQSNQIHYPHVPYFQGPLMGESPGQQPQQKGSQVPYKQQQQEVSQVPYTQQQGSQFPYQQQPQRQGSQFPFQQQLQQQGSQVSFQQQQLQGSQVPFEQHHQQHGSLAPYQEHEQLQTSKLQFHGNQQPQVSQTSQHHGQQQPEGQQIAAYQQGKQRQGQQITANLQGQQIGFLRMEEFEQQEGKHASLSLPQVQPTGSGSSNHHFSGPTNQIHVSQGGFSSLELQHQLFGGQSSSDQPFSELASRSQQFSGLPSGGQQFNGPSSVAQQFSGLPSGGQQFNGLPSVAQQFSGPSSSGQHFRGLSSGAQQLSGQNFGISSVQMQLAGTDSSYQQRQMSSPMVPNQVGQAMPRPMVLPIGNEDRRWISGNEFLSSSKNEGIMMPSQLPKLAPLPQRWNPQDVTEGGVSSQFVLPAHSSELNLAPGRDRCNHPSFPNSASTRPPQSMLGASEFTNITAADTYRLHHEITIMGDNIPAPFMTFEATGFPPEILREMHSAGFLSPTPIQAQTWPVALQSRDIVAIAKTGSGKTLGYLVPAFILLRHCRNNPQFGPTVLVLAPTRELATQIQDEAIKFGRSSRVSCTSLYGGAQKGHQLREIERGADIVVATPGRLNDILDMKKINLRQVSLLVIDEADRMLDMGFEPQIRKIVSEIPKRRQTLMYTATWPKEVRKIASDLLVNPVQVNIGSIDELAANKSITQYVEVVPPEDKQRRLEQILRSNERGTKIIIFCSTKRQCDQLARGIGRTFGAASIHGDKSQDEREHTLNQFRCGNVPILVATDVAARGLDIKDISVVINYDFPTAIEDYIHRIGRTGRAGATGVSYTLFSHQDWKYAADLIKVLEGANQRVPPEVREMAARGGPPSFSRGGVSRWDSGGGRGNGQWESGGGRSGGMRDFGGGRGFGGRGGGGARNDFYGGRGSMRGRGFSGPSAFAGPGGRHDHRGPCDRYRKLPDGRGRFDGGSRRGYGERGRDQGYSRSPGKVHSRGYNRSRSRSRTRSRSLSRSWSRSQSRSWSRSRSKSRSRSRSRSRSYDRYDRPRRKSLFSDAPGLPEEVGRQGAPSLEAPAVSGFSDVPPLSSQKSLFSDASGLPEEIGGRQAPRFEASTVSGFSDVPPLSGDLSPMSPGQDNGLFPANEIPNPGPFADRSVVFASRETGLEPGKQ